jgi:tetratricopeptide (TPR) repeat protein
MAHALKGNLHLLGTEPAVLPVARACYEAAANLPADERERGHVEAVRLLSQGRWRAAGRLLEDLSIAFPRDRLALQVGHQIDFFRGDSRMLRDRIARALPQWNDSMPGHHAVLGMHAFGLEEAGDYAQAEKQGRAAIERQRRDTWAWHAVAHVHEMRNRPEDGIAWMTADTDAWAQDSFFSVRNGWHLALYHLELGAADEVLQLFDGPIFSKRSNVVLDMVDASAMLWCLHLRGVNVRNRFEQLADLWAPIAAAGNYAFNDMHAMMAFAGSLRTKEQQRVLDTQCAVLASGPDQAADNYDFTREVGHAATRAIQAFGTGRYAECVELLRPVRNIAHRFGGSHAQRDLLDLTLFEASRRAGQEALATALIRERVAVRPRTALAALLQSSKGPLAKAA